MQIYFFYLVLFAIIFVTYSILNFFIFKYFDFKKSRATSPNYPFIKALQVLFVAFSIKNGLSDQIFELGSKFLIENFSLNITTEPPQSSLVSEIIFYVTVFAILTLYTILSIKQIQKEAAEEIRNETPRPKLEIPDIQTAFNPIFHQRVKHLVESKYEREKLTLNYDREIETLYGRYKSGLHYYTKVVICHASISNQIVKEDDIQDKYLQVRNKLLSNNVYTEEDVIEYYFILENGEMLSYPSHIICLTEDQFLDGLVDFDRYLEKLVTDFQNQKLPFSNIENKMTLKETFIKPYFTIGVQNQEQRDLSEYLDTWLNESSYKQMVILGDYGMGKSTFSKYYSVTLANRILQNDNLIRYPVFISLTNTSPRHGGINNSISKFIADNLGVTTDVFKILIDRGKLVFILDGFDEMGFIGTNDQRIKQLNAIWQLATKNNKLLISGRPSYFPNDAELKYALNIDDSEKLSVPNNSPYFERIYLSKYDDEQIQRSLSFYYVKEECEKYINFIKGNSSIYDLCKRPSMMHIVREMIPEIVKNSAFERFTAGLLMDRYIMHWIDRQLQKDIISVIEDKKIKANFIRSFFIDLAALYAELGVEKLDSSFLIEFIDIKVSQLQLDNDNQEDLQGFQTEILAGYFIEIDSDQYRFVHKSFKEYFISQKILKLLKERNFDDILIKKVDWSIEVIDFIYDDISKDYDPSTLIPSLLISTSRNRFSALLRSKFFKLGKKSLFLSNYFIYYFYSPLIKYLNRKHPKFTDGGELVKYCLEHFKDSKTIPFGLLFEISFNPKNSEFYKDYVGEQTYNMTITEKAFYISLTKQELKVRRYKYLKVYFERYKGKTIAEHNKVESDHTAGI